MGIIPIPEIEAELLVRGVLVKQWLRDPEKPQQGPSPPFLLVGGLPQSRTLTNGLGRWVAKYLTPDAIKAISKLPKHLQWEAVRDMYLSNEEMLDLAQRLGVGQPVPAMPYEAAVTPDKFKDWWTEQVKSELKERRA